MATRSNIIITGGEGPDVYLYRHWDGYPAENGADLLEAVKRAAFADKCGLANQLLKQQRAATEYQPEPSMVYELTDQIHSDIKHLYIVRRAPGYGAAEWTIQHRGGEPGVYGEELARDLKAYTLAEFAELVNAERREFNANIAQNYAATGTQPGPDYTPYQPIAA